MPLYEIPILFLTEQVVPNYLFNKEIFFLSYQEKSFPSTLRKPNKENQIRNWGCVTMNPLGVSLLYLIVYYNEPIEGIYKETKP